MTLQFASVNVHEKFSTDENKKHYIEYEKISDKQAKIISQVGYNNPCLIGLIELFSAYNVVYLTGE